MTLEVPARGAQAFEVLRIARGRRRSHHLESGAAGRSPSRIADARRYLVAQRVRIGRPDPECRPGRSTRSRPAAETLRHKGPPAVVVTLGERGALILLDEYGEEFDIRPTRRGRRFQRCRRCLFGCSGRGAGRGKVVVRRRDLRQCRRRIERNAGRNAGVVPDS